MARRVNKGRKPDPLTLSIWEGLSELASWPDLSANVGEALERLETYREKRRTARRKAARSSSSTLGSMAIVCATLGALVSPGAAPFCAGKKDFTYCEKIFGQNGL